MLLLHLIKAQNNLNTSRDRQMLHLAVDAERVYLILAFLLEWIANCAC